MSPRRDSRQNCPGGVCRRTSSSADTGTSSAATSTLPSVTADSSVISSSASTVAAASTSVDNNAGTIAGCVIGGVVFLVLVALAALIYLRARKRRRTPPSSEFMNSIRDGAAPVLRLESRAEHSPVPAEKGGGYVHYPPAVPPPFMHKSYYTSPPMLDAKFPEETMVDTPSARASVERPLQPLRYSSQRQANDSFVAHHHTSTSLGSRRELWGSDIEVVSAELSPVRRSPAHTDSVLHFASRFSLDDTSPQPSIPSHSPPSLHPLRRPPSLEGPRSVYID